MSRRRLLSDDEDALWRTVARSIKPLRPSPKTTKPSVKSSIVAPAASESAPVKMPPRPITPREAPLRAQSPPLAPLGRRLKQRVARGREPIDARLDLHGMTQRQAHAALLRFLHRAQGEGAKTVLVVTGKGSGKQSNTGQHDAEREPGVLKRQVPMWLSLPEFRLLIVGFDDAHVGHGGQGALYVRLRRGR
jgi:DNA-nicking Smr family endonuclease